MAQDEEREAQRMRASAEQRNLRTLHPGNPGSERGLLSGGDNMQVAVYDSRIVPRDLYLELRLIEERGIRLRRSRQSRIRKLFGVWWNRFGARPTAA